MARALWKGIGKGGKKMGKTNINILQKCVEGKGPSAWEKKASWGRVNERKEQTPVKRKRPNSTGAPQPP